MSRFVRDWTDSDFHVVAVAPAGSQQVAIGGDGGDGANGANGTAGDALNAPGPGHDGHAGGIGGDAYADGTLLTFSHKHPLGTWLSSATSGAGGNGGDGGNAGKFPDGVEYDGSFPDGGYGADGGDSGNATAAANDHNVYGFTGRTGSRGISLTVSATASGGGAGGDGGNGDGFAGSTKTGGDGGNGGFGRDSGYAQAEMHHCVFDHVTKSDDPNHFEVAVNLSAQGGHGGAGGHGGKGGLGTPRGNEGIGGEGGNGGDAVIIAESNTFQLGHGGGGSSTLSIIASVDGGAGGNGGADGRNAGSGGAGGVGGYTSLTFHANVIQGGAEDDVVRLAFSNSAGNGGLSGDGTLHTVNGVATNSIYNNSFDGGGGHNSLLFSWSGGATALAVDVDLSIGEITIDGGTSTVMHFQDVTGGSAGDGFIGNGNANVLNGAAGDDELRGMANADTLTGGAGHDNFIFIDTHESSGPTYDRITDLNFNQDKIGVDFDVAHVDAVIGGATISKASFDADIAGAVGNLRSHHAVVVTAKHGNLQDHTFLVIEGNGVKGYQPGLDIVIDVTGITGTMTLSDFFNAH